MTREEAYNRIDAIIEKHEVDDVYITITNHKDYDALRMAREALEQEPCEDCISRQAVLDLCDSKDPDYKVIHFKEDVECLPSVHSQKVSGWIPCSERLPEEEGQYLCITENRYGRRVDIELFSSGDFISRNKITHWMYMPEMLKAESEDKEC